MGTPCKMIVGSIVQRDVATCDVLLLLSMNPFKGKKKKTKRRRGKKAKQSEQHSGGLIGFLLSRIYYKASGEKIGRVGL